MSTHIHDLCKLILSKDFLFNIRKVFVSKSELIITSELS